MVFGNLLLHRCLTCFSFSSLLLLALTKTQHDHYYHNLHHLHHFHHQPTNQPPPPPTTTSARVLLGAWKQPGLVELSVAVPCPPRCSFSPSLWVWWRRYSSPLAPPPLVTRLVPACLTLPESFSSLLRL